MESGLDTTIFEDFKAIWDRKQGKIGAFCLPMSI
jgi:hypothetical protein